MSDTSYVDAQGYELRKKIEVAINSVSAEQNSNTPDYILAQFLIDCLAAFDRASIAKDRWYGKTLSTSAAHTEAARLADG